jgi:hypothetical protein
MAEMNARWNQQEQAPLAHRNKYRLHGYRRETCQSIQLEHYIFAIEHVVGKINTLIDAFRMVTIMFLTGVRVGF